MAQKHLFTFPCPCCGKKVEVDTRTGKARAVRSGDALGGGFDDLIANHKKERERLSGAFDSATKDQETDVERLERLLREAKRDVKDNPDDDGPARPFDLD